MKGNLVHFNVAADANSDELDEMDEEVPSIMVGDWCSVEYEGVIYPGEMKAVWLMTIKYLLWYQLEKIGNGQLALTKYTIQNRRW